MVAGPYALAGQAGGEGVGAAVEFAVREERALVFGGDAVRGGRGPPFEGAVDQRDRDADGGAVAVLPEEALVAGVRWRRGMTERTSWLFEWGGVRRAEAVQRRLAARGLDCSSGSSTLN